MSGRATANAAGGIRRPRRPRPRRAPAADPTEPPDESPPTVGCPEHGEGYDRQAQVLGVELQGIGAPVALPFPGKPCYEQLGDVIPRDGIGRRRQRYISAPRPRWLMNGSLHG